MPESYIAVLKDTIDGVKKSFRVGEDANAHLDGLSLKLDNHFVKEVFRKIKESFKKE